MGLNFDCHEGELMLLGDLLRRAALYAQARIEAIPASAGYEQEEAIVEAVIGPAAALAEHIVTLSAQSARGNEVKRQAQAWLDGKCGGYLMALAQAA
jgi:hypothetical protein